MIPRQLCCHFLVVFFLNIIASKVVVFVNAAEKVQNKPRVPINVLHKAIRYVTETVSDSEERVKQLQELNDGNVHTLYQVAKAMNHGSSDRNPDNKVTSMEIWHALADTMEDGHILSQVALGFAYADNDKPRAIAYFVQAGEAGPHQSALYNAGRLLADPEMEEFVKALAYLRAAYSVAESHPKYATEHLTETSRYAFEKLSEDLVFLIQKSLSSKGSVLSIQQVADMFLYANLKDFPPPSSKGEKTWQGAMEALQSERWELSLIQLDKLEKEFESELSQLQLSLLKVLREYVRSASEMNRGEGEL